MNNEATPANAISILITRNVRLLTWLRLGILVPGLKPPSDQDPYIGNSKGNLKKDKPSWLGHNLPERVTQIAVICPSTIPYSWCLVAAGVLPKNSFKVLGLTCRPSIVFHLSTSFVFRSFPFFPFSLFPSLWHLTLSRLSLIPFQFLDVEFA